MCRAVVLFLPLLLSLLVSGCVTETRGGYTTPPSREMAFQKRVSLARQYIGEGNWEYAKRNLQLAAKIDPNNAEVHEAFALVYQSTGEYELAEESFKRALSSQPGLSRARNNYAAFLFSQGRMEQAEEEFTRVTEDTLYSGRPLAFINLGLARVRLGRAEGAEQAFARALAMDRRNPIALLELGYLRLAAGDPEAALQYYDVYRTVVRQQPARGLLLGIRIAQLRGDTDAEASYGLALRARYPDSPEYRAYRAGN